MTSADKPTIALLHTETPPYYLGPGICHKPDADGPLYIRLDNSTLEAQCTLARRGRTQALARRGAVDGFCSSSWQ